jgi:hypothetical protein
LRWENLLRSRDGAVDHSPIVAQPINLDGVNLLDVSRITHEFRISTEFAAEAMSGAT